MRLDPGRFGKPDWNPPAGLPPWFLSGFVPGMLLRPVLCPFRSCSWSAKPGCRKCSKSALRVESPCEAIIFRGILIDCVLWGYCKAVTKKDNWLIINCFFCAPGASILEHFLVGFGCDLGYGAVFSTTIMENYFFAIYYGIGNFFLSCNVRIND